ncbi:MAG: Maf family protein [Clostridiales bacterium]|nr:Maf family protein [Clostridiales bacterium]
MSDLTGKKLILASASPRRQAVMAQLGLITEVRPSGASEIKEGLPPALLVTENALRKAGEVAGRTREAALVIGADTVVVKEGRILGKPRDEEEALSMLRFLSGGRHDVISAAAVIDAQTGREAAGHSQTAVFFATLPEELLRAYVATGEPLDKAGAYGIQGLGALLVERIEGDYGTVVGLCPRLLARLLREFGAEIF